MDYSPFSLKNISLEELYNPKTPTNSFNFNIFDLTDAYFFKLRALDNGIIESIEPCVGSFKKNVENFDVLYDTFLSVKARKYISEKKYTSVEEFDKSLSVVMLNLYYNDGSFCTAPCIINREIPRENINNFIKDLRDLVLELDSVKLEVYNSKEVLISKDKNGKNQRFVNDTTLPLAYKVFKSGKGEKSITKIDRGASIIIQNSKMLPRSYDELPPMILCGCGSVIIDNLSFIFLYKENGRTCIAVSLKAVSGTNILLEYDISKVKECDSDEYKIMKKALGFCLNYYSLLLLENKPIEIKNTEKGEGKKENIRNIKNNSLITRTVYLSKRYKQIKRDRVANNHFDKNNKELAIVQVCGYERIQHYGVNNSKTKRIYVESFSRNQWVTSGLVCVTVKE